MEPVVKCPSCRGPVVKQGDRNYCPVCRRTFCGRPMEVFSRVVGYHRPVNLWNKGKQEEFKARRPYSWTAIEAGLMSPARTPKLA